MLLLDLTQQLQRIFYIVQLLITVVQMAALGMLATLLFTGPTIAAANPALFLHRTAPQHLAMETKRYQGEADGSIEPQRKLPFWRRILTGDPEERQIRLPFLASASFFLASLIVCLFTLIMLVTLVATPLYVQVGGGYCHPRAMQLDADLSSSDLLPLHLWLQALRTARAQVYDLSLELVPFVDDTFSFFGVLFISTRRIMDDVILASMDFIIEVRESPSIHFVIFRKDTCSEG